MTAPAIRVDGLWKEYVIGGAAAHGRTFREAMMESLSGPFRKGGGTRPSTGDSRFWALQDVSFAIEPGEVVGIIGGNGAGKSTLLKILSRITAPTRGEVTIAGRVASLLEVGTGFHPELTGRENVRLNGAILGMSQAEIRRKFDEIVDFAGIETFIDTPVKRYSSGMQVRLAFAVAAHLDPEILLIDEVLAVGDAQFQSKCLGKMREVASGQGRTVLFVSHNLAAVRSLCPRSIVLRKGSVEFDGESREAISRYYRALESGKADGGATLYQVPDGGSSATKPAVVRVEILHEGRPASSVLSYQELEVQITFRAVGRHRGLSLSAGLANDLCGIIYSSNAADTAGTTFDVDGLWRASFKIPKDTLLTQEYHIVAVLWSDAAGQIDYVETARFTVEAPPEFFKSDRKRGGILAARLDWQTTLVEPVRERAI